MIIYVILFPIITLFNFEFLNKKNNAFRIISLIILIAFIGFRYGVGVDYFNYQDIFHSGDNASWIEPGYFYLMKFVHVLNNKFYLVTSIVAFITVFFLYQGLKDLTPYFAFSIFLFLVFPSGYGFSVNGMRQGITAAIFLYSIKYIIEGNFIKYLILLLLGSLFHISLLVMIPFYFIRKIEFKRYLSLLIIVISIILNQFNVFKSLLLKILSFTPWKAYLLVKDILENTETSSGLGFMFINILGLIIIFLVPKKIIEQKKYAIIFNLYVVFLVLRNILFSVAIMYRLVVYFDWISFLAIPIFISYTFNKPSRKLIMSVLIILFSILFFRALINPTYMLEYKFIDV